MTLAFAATEAVEQQNRTTHFRTFGAAACVQKVGSHHWSMIWNWPRVYPTKREALLALATYMDDIMECAQVPV